MLAVAEEAPRSDRFTNGLLIARRGGRASTRGLETTIVYDADGHAPPAREGGAAFA